MNSNKFRRLFLASALVLTALPAFASWNDWWQRSIEGSGRIVKQERAVKDFRGVSISVPGRVELRQGEQEGVQIETDDNIQAILDVVVEGDTLKIRTKEKNTVPKTKTLIITVNLKRLDDLALEGSGTVRSAKLNSTDLKIRVGGSGNVNVADLNVESLKVTIGGSGSFTARGTAPQISAAIGGSGELDMAKLAAKDVRVSIGGSGSVRTWVSDNLNVSIGGSGDVVYWGDPRLSKSIGGSGSVVRKGATP